ncbi:helix-turn-helix domain-containing protein, partial [Enterococcus faecium]
MIKVNLDKYIEKYNLNINQLSKETGISRKALTALANYNKDENPPVSIQYNTIEILCKYFKIGVD